MKKIGEELLKYLGRIFLNNNIFLEFSVNFGENLEIPTLKFNKPTLHPYGTLYSVVIGIDMNINTREKY